jgi:hypothetical protein
MTLPGCKTQNPTEPLILLGLINMAEGVGFEPAQPPSKQADFPNDLPHGQAVASLTASQNAVARNPELSEIFQSWPKLSANTRLAILALIRASIEKPLNNQNAQASDHR